MGRMGELGWIRGCGEDGGTGVDKRVWGGWGRRGG